jgi:ketosteroid isomerase-like protein
MKQVTILLLYATFLFSCNSAKQNPNKDEIYKLTKAANDASLQGHIEKNIDKITTVYTADAIVLPPGGEKPVVGIDSIKSYYKKGLEGVGRSTAITTENIRYDMADENNATELGKYVIKYKASDTSSITEFKGEMLIVWKKVDGQWKIYLDMWH